MNYLQLIISFCSLLVTGCVNFNTQYNHTDPLESFNRSMYTFNSNLLDPYLLYPVSLAWRNYIPQYIRYGIINFTSNLEEPSIMLNYLIQGNPYQGMIHFTRFFLNTVLGIGGIIDVAGFSNYKLHREQPCRLGCTLGRYKIGYGPYIHLPFYGSFTLRNDVGNMIDTFYFVISWLNLPLSTIKWILERIEMRAQLIESTNMLQHSVDAYITTRESYFQYHDFIVSGCKLTLGKNLNSEFIENEFSEIDVD